MNIRLTQIDGKLPNMALMKLAHWHKSQGHQVVFEKSVTRGMFEPEYGKVYGSAIFKESRKKVGVFKRNFPDAIVGGTWNPENIKMTVESVIGEELYENYDYSIYPSFNHSIGFTQRGCRLRCSFCVVPKKEGKNAGVNSIYDIWRGEGFPKKIHLLDNDFFGQSDWQKRADEIIKGKFKVCFNQGINVRLIHQEGAEALAKMKYTDDSFEKKRLYTAWDNKRDENIFLKGIKILNDAGIKNQNIMVYMLCGYWKGETWDDIFYRFNMMNEMGLMPYPMVYMDDDRNSLDYRLLKQFQEWVIRRYYQFTSFKDFTGQTESQFLEKKRAVNNYQLFG